MVALWRGKDPYFTDPSDLQTILKKRVADEWKVNLDLFHHIDDLSENEKNIITKLLGCMLDVDPNNRPSLDDCLAKFLHLMLQDKINHAPEEEKSCILSAFYISQQALTELEEIEQISWIKRQVSEALSVLKYRHDITVAKCESVLMGKFAKLPHQLIGKDLMALRQKLHIDQRVTMTELFAVLDATTSPVRLIAALEKQVELLTDNEHVIGEFIDNIDQQCLVGIKTKGQLTEKLKSILSHYQVQLSVLSERIVAANLTENKMLQAELQHLHSKTANPTMTLDALVYHACHIERKLHKLDEEYAVKKTFAI